MKGDPKLTIKMKNAHTKYMADFDNSSPKDEEGNPFQWRPWLNYNGYELDESGHVYPMEEEDVVKRERELKGR